MALMMLAAFREDTTGGFADRIGENKGIRIGLIDQVLSRRSSSRVITVKMMSTSELISNFPGRILFRLCIQ